MSGWRGPSRLAAALAVYVITDRVLARGRAEVAVAAAALAGGATAIQLRRKEASGRNLCDLGRALARMCDRVGALFVVNDRLDVALACGAGGVHLGQEDIPVADARAVAGRDLVIGVSAANPAEAAAAARGGADYLGTGAVFATASKPDAGRPIGVVGLSQVAAATRLPVVAIGGIHADAVRELVDAGASGVAVIAAVVAAQDVRAATSRLAAAVAGALAPGGATR